MAWKTAGGSGGGSGATACGNTQFRSVATGALTANNPTSVAHGLVGCTSFSFTVSDGYNNVLVKEITVDPANPTTHFLIQAGINIPSGYIVKCFGSPTGAPLVINERTGNVVGSVINAGLGFLVIAGGFTPNINRSLRLPTL